MRRAASPKKDANCAEVHKDILSKASIERDTATFTISEMDAGIRRTVAASELAIKESPASSDWTKSSVRVMS
ncbi:unannotated protein [freshwater metagenome]|uniref:Unannotated protein n=1 Tax=freshwater metagenome TaxID=449393 RepID=A0A6J6DUP4_9ZZZZ